jgi:hypothetical protein
MTNLNNNPYFGKEAKIFLKFGKPEYHDKLIKNFVDYHKKLELYENLENQYIICDDIDKCNLIQNEMKDITFYLKIFIKDIIN